MNVFLKQYRVYLNSLRICLFSYVFVSLFFLSHVFAIPLVLNGRVVYPTGEFQRRYIVIDKGLIQSISESIPDDVPCDATVIYTEGYIYPGLINLHTHLGYNVLPLWKEAHGQFHNRFEWRKDDKYKADIRKPYSALNEHEDKKFKKGMVIFDELQALSGGTTLLQESHALDKEVNEATRRMTVRGTDYPEDLELENDKKIVSVIDLFEPRVTQPPNPKDGLARFQSLREKNKIQAFIPHLAEGRTGFLRDHGFDEYSRKEFEAFMNHDIFSDSKHTPKPPIALVHASGVDPNNKNHIHFLKQWNVGIIWSPVSNLLLYGDTLDAETLLQKGITMALGSDWSPSGSKHVLDEGRMAKFYLNTLGTKVSDEQIFQMMTVNPAKLIGHPHLGEIKRGNLADLFIIEDPEKWHSAMETLFETDTRYIRLVLIRGKIAYGDNGLTRQSDLGMQPLPEKERVDAWAKNKIVYIDPAMDIQLNDVVERIEDYLKKNFDIKRSNSLTPTDIPYQQRMNELKQFMTVTFGHR